MNCPFLPPFSIPLLSPFKRGRPDVASRLLHGEARGCFASCSMGEFKASLLAGERFGERFSRSREK